METDIPDFSDQQLKREKEENKHLPYIWMPKNEMTACSGRPGMIEEMWWPKGPPNFLKTLCNNFRLIYPRFPGETSYWFVTGSRMGNFYTAYIGFFDYVLKNGDVSRRPFNGEPIHKRTYVAKIEVVKGVGVFKVWKTNHIDNPTEDKHFILPSWPWVRQFVQQAMYQAVLLKQFSSEANLLWDWMFEYDSNIKFANVVYQFPYHRFRNLNLNLPSPRHTRSGVVGNYIVEYRTTPVHNEVLVLSIEYTQSLPVEYFDFITVEMNVINETFTVVFLLMEHIPPRTFAKLPEVATYINDTVSTYLRRPAIANNQLTITGAFWEAMSKLVAIMDH
jgi:hypothetical protein